MAEKMFKALVIDDEPARNKTYENVLSSRFAVDFENEIIKITKRRVIQYDLLVIDICLSKSVRELTAFKILSDYDITIPTVLVSGEWVNEKGEPNEFILQVPNYKNVIKVVSWNDFNMAESNTRIAESIYYEFCKVRNIAMENGTDRCVILHMSDMQFGGFLSGAACNDNVRIATFVKDNRQIPDFIVISGDIADKSCAKEYDEAKKWIEDLARELWGIEGELKYSDRQRIIFTPGNHDYNVSNCASDAYSFSFGAAEKDSFIKNASPDFTIHQKNGFSSFVEFARNLSEDDSWFKFLRRVVHVNERFLNYGINLFTLNSVFGINSRNCENRFDEFYCDLSKRTADELKCDKYQSDVLNILIMHNPPEDFHKSTEAGETSWGRFQTIIQDNKIRICLYGHTHDVNPPKLLGDGGGDYCKNLLCISAPSLRLAAASRTEDASRGFNIIELNKEGTEYGKIVIKNCELKKAEISVKNQDTFLNKNNRWIPE